MRLVVAVFMSLVALGAGIALGAEEFEGLADSPSADSRIELLDERTATSKTFQLPEGARETQIFASPIHYRDAEGEWQPIGEGFQETDEGALGNGANAFDVELPEYLGEEPVQLSTEEGWVSAELIGPDTQEAQLQDGAVSYESTDGDTTFEYTTLPDGLKENIEIADASEPTSFSFELSASGGLTPELIENGSVEFRDEEGEVLFILPAPTMYDSAGMAPAGAIHYELEPQGESHWRLLVQADPEWLSQPEREWPVTIDPTIEIPSPTLDCAIGGKKGEVGWGACGSGGQKELPLAYKPDLNSAKDEWSRGLLRFSLKSIPADSYIASATFKALAPEAALNTSGVELRRTTKKWTSYANWLNYDYDPGHKTTFPWTTEGGDYSTEVSSLLTSERGSAAGWWDFPLSAPMVEELAPQTKEEGRKIVESPLEFIAKLTDDKSRVCGAESCTQRRVSFESSAAILPQNRPYLSVTYYTSAPAGSQITSPADGTRSAKRFKLAAKWNHQGVTGITFQYKTPTRWVDIPAAKVTDSDNQIVKWPLAIEGGAHESPPVYWDAVEALGPGYVAKGNIRAILVGAIGADGYTPPVEVELNREIGGTKDASAPVGPGAVSLLTGNFTLTRTDVSIPGFGSALEFTRTHSSRDAASGSKSVLGPGWKPGAAVEAAGGAEWRSVKLETATIEEENEEGKVEVVPIGEYALLADLEGYEYAFEKVEGKFLTPPELAGWVLTTSGSTFILADPDGNSTTFENNAGGNEYLPVSITQTGGEGNKTKMVYAIVGGNRRLEMIIAPTAPGITCTKENVKTTAGCRSLIFTYKAATAWGAPAELGDRLSTIAYWGPSGPTTTSSWNVAQYAYNAEGRLLEQWDPRLAALKEAYTYTSGGQLSTITPPGEEPWSFEYGTFEEGTPGGRLIAVKRPSLVSEPALAQTTISYGVPLSGEGAPYDMSPAAVAQWGQEDLPADATAIFPPDQVPSSPPSSYSRATVFYLDAEGQLVNTASPSGAGTSAPSITTAETDEFGNVVRELSAQNRLRALAAGSESVKRSHELEAKYLYSANGTEMQEGWGPLHQVRLESGSSVQARIHTTVQYDEGWPGTGVKPHLQTRETTGASIPGQGIDADVRVTETKYDWALRQGTETITDPLGLNLRSRVVYDSASGMPVEIRQPANPNGGDARTTKIIYYSSGSSPDSACANNKGWAGLPCKVTPAAQPGTEGQPELLVTRYASYNQLGQPTETIESPGGKEATTRKTITVYDNAGRVKTTKQEGGGTALPKQENLYWSTTGRLKTKRFVCEVECEGFDTQAVTSTYDTLGRLTAYTDADAKKSTFSYDLLGRRVSAYDTKGTQTMTYDATSGLLVSLADTAAGTFTASYDASGRIIEEGLPNGLVANTTYDEAGEPISLTYTKVTNCSSECTWLSFDAERSIFGQVFTQTSTLSSQAYSYDKAGRLLSAKDTPAAGGCTTREYGYDADSNRTAMVTRAPGAGGVCTTSGGTTQEYKYDAADRLIGAGISYDGFGRITSLPGEYAGGSQLSTTFFSNDLVATQSQGSITNSYKLDAALRPRERVQTGGSGGTEVWHYSGEGDSPSWTAKGTAWTRNITSIGGELAAIQDSASGTSLQLTNLHGDVVATASLSQTATKPTATFEFDEFGNPKQTPTPRYGWHGSALRPTELPSGVIQMGARSYVPSLGRFLSVDPVLGGSANSYDCGFADPVNNFDPTGLASKGVRRLRDFRRLRGVQGHAKRQYVRDAKSSHSRAQSTAKMRRTSHAAFRKATNEFHRHPGWGKACHDAFRTMRLQTSGLKPLVSFRRALDACVNRVRGVAEHESRIEAEEERERREREADQIQGDIESGVGDIEKGNDEIENAF